VKIYRGQSNNTIIQFLHVSPVASEKQNMYMNIKTSECLKNYAGGTSLVITILNPSSEYVCRSLKRLGEAHPPLCYIASGHTKYGVYGDSSR
jgi:hypothetical protein